MSIIDTAKQLLKKGIALNDSELIEMANNLLASVADSPSAATDLPEASTPRPNPGSPDVAVEASTYLTPTKKGTDSFRKGVPVNEIPDRVNEFVDTGEDHTDIVTPPVDPTTRRPPHTKHTQKCQECKQSVDVLDTHRREHFVCDSCLSSKRR